jgi:hypothetical protein
VRLRMHVLPRRFFPENERQETWKVAVSSLMRHLYIYEYFSCELLKIDSNALVCQGMKEYIR